MKQFLLFSLVMAVLFLASCIKDTCITFTDALGNEVVHVCERNCRVAMKACKEECAKNPNCNPAFCDAGCGS